MKMGILFPLLLVGVSSIYCQQTFPTTANIADVADKINQLITDNSLNVNGRTEHPFLAGFVRLTFHDCVGDGHCDGCLDLGAAENAGLQRYADPLNSLYDTDAAINSVMSRADFYVLAGNVALETASQSAADQYSYQGRMLVGRESCQTSPDEDGDSVPNGFPSGLWDIDKVTEYFSDEFGMDTEQSVAILGAHTLGRCSSQNSGFEGKWLNGFVNDVAQSDILDNRYYIAMRGPWVQVPITGSDGVERKQWQIPGTRNNQNVPPLLQTNMFLNSDICVRSNLQTFGPVDETDGTVSCNISPRPPSCGQSPVNTNFQTFSTNNAEWLRVFSEAFHQMTHDESETLQKPS